MNQNITEQVDEKEKRIQRRLIKFNRENQCILGKLSKWVESERNIFPLAVLLPLCGAYSLFLFLLSDMFVSRMMLLLLFLTCIYSVIQYWCLTIMDPGFVQVIGESDMYDDFLMQPPTRTNAQFNDLGGLNESSMSLSFPNNHDVGTSRVNDTMSQVQMPTLPKQFPTSTASLSIPSPSSFLPKLGQKVVLPVDSNHIGTTLQPTQRLSTLTSFSQPQPRPDQTLRPIDFISRPRSTLPPLSNNQPSYISPTMGTAQSQYQSQPQQHQPQHQDHHHHQGPLASPPEPNPASGIDFSSLHYEYDVEGGQSASTNRMRNPTLSPAATSPSSSQPTTSLDTESLDAAEISRKTMTRFCTSCVTVCPARSRHCENCSRCVVSKDHHCAFIGRCVGQRNMRLFFQFLLLNYSLSCLAFIVFVYYFLIYTPAPGIPPQSTSLKGSLIVFCLSLLLPLLGFYIFGTLLSRVWFTLGNDMTYIERIFYNRFFRQSQDNNYDKNLSSIGNPLAIEENDEESLAKRTSLSSLSQGELREIGLRQETMLFSRRLGSFFGWINNAGLFLGLPNRSSAIFVLIYLFIPPFDDVLSDILNEYDAWMMSRQRFLPLSQIR